MHSFATRAKAKTQKQANQKNLGLTHAYSLQFRVGAVWAWGSRVSGLGKYGLVQTLNPVPS